MYRCVCGACVSCSLSSYVVIVLCSVDVFCFRCMSFVFIGCSMLCLLLCVLVQSLCVFVCVCICCSRR